MTWVMFGAVWLAVTLNCLALAIVVGSVLRLRTVLARRRDPVPHENQIRAMLDAVRLCLITIAGEPRTPTQVIDQVARLCPDSVSVESVLARMREQGWCDAVSDGVVTRLALTPAGYAAWFAVAHQSGVL